MGYWGWRRLAAVFISVWVVGCTITHDAAPTIPPTHLPKVTLTLLNPATPTPQFTPQALLAVPALVTPTPLLYTVQPGDTLLQIARRFGVDPAFLQTSNGGLEPRMLQIGQELTIPQPLFSALGAPMLPTPFPVAVEVEPPTCFSTPTDYILCLGQVRNPLEMAVERVTVMVYLLRADGSPLVNGRASVEQNYIPPGGVAPYRVLLKANWRDFAGSAAVLQSADSAPDALARYITLDVFDQRHGLSDGQYTISAVLHNPDAGAARLYRAVVMLNDSLGQITGYRVVQLDRVLTTDERMPLEIAVIPQVSDATTQHRLYVEAERALVVTPE